MKEFNYEEVAKEIGWNFSKAKYHVEQDVAYDYYKAVVQEITPQTKLLDIGCGSAEKSCRYFAFAKQVVGIDAEPEMLKRARANAVKYYGEKADKFQFQTGDCFGVFEFVDQEFDLVVSRHCGANMSEVFRVLKKNGVFVSEDIDRDDCLELKNYFSRGQNYGKEELEKQVVMNECLKIGFSKIELLNFEQHEFYDVESLVYLLEHTPILNGFDKECDMEILKKYCDDFYVDGKGVELIRRLYAFKMVK